MTKLTSLLFVCFLLLGFDEEPKLIGLQPFDDINAEYIDEIKSAITQVYGIDVKILPVKDIPKSAFVHIKTPRYRADSIIRILRKEKSNDLDFVMGLTSKDISTTKRDRYGNILEPETKYKDWGIFGLGFRPGPTSVVSTFRLKTGNKIVFIDRLRKICVHELGHNMGLRHCNSDENCVMRDAAEKISTIDQVELMLCEECQKKLK